MNEHLDERCPECGEPVQLAARTASVPVLNRRGFIRAVGGAVGLATTGGLVRAADEPASQRTAKPAESLIHELYAGLSETQKKTLVLPMDHGSNRGTPTRLGMYNSPIQNQTLGDNYTKAQQELIEKILRAILADDEAFKRISRNGSWDNGRKFLGCGAHIFGEAVPGKKFAWVFTGHHITLRADGEFTEGPAWGGPMFYGHSAPGYSETNVYYFQTRGVLNVYKALDPKQREKAVVVGSPNEGPRSIQFKKTADTRPGISYPELSAEQKALVEKVMRDILSPYRKEDADEVMEIVKGNGGLEKIKLAFYRDQNARDAERWHFWRLEGPGFVWNYRVLPHVHCYVNIDRVPA
jgi:hypothetical protein